MNYKLIMMGFPIVYEDNSFSDNAAFWESYRWPEVRIIKNFMSIGFYSVLKSVRSSVMRVIFVKGKKSLDVFFTKLIPGINKQGLCGRFTY